MFDKSIKIATLSVAILILAVLIVAALNQPQQEKKLGTADVPKDFKFICPENVCQYCLDAPAGYAKNIFYCCADVATESGIATCNFAEQIATQNNVTFYRVVQGI